MPPTAAQLQQQFIKLRENKIFETFVILVIVISALMIGAKTYPIPSSVAQTLRLLDVGITIFFLVEIIIRMIADQSLKRFFSKAWNVF
ncbi:MAG: ion transporter, partial [Candidatus Thiodiazotropha taylori]|nr:ion transporter [Candidatus Thiodiazotropha taylori]MCW4253347.1 ion transporter [Candidatus Thiodiazotropha taylori]